MIVLIASSILLILYCVRKHKKPAVKKNTLELNEEEFRENIEQVKKVNDYGKESDDNKYVDFNEE